jgi:hypothetical protein
MLQNFFVRNFEFSKEASVCWTSLEKLTRDKHSSLLRKLVNDGQKSFITLAVVIILIFV